MAFALGLTGKSSSAAAGGFPPPPPPPPPGQFPPPPPPGGPACFLPGTLIETPRGKAPIEWLRIGDEVYTLSGEAKRIKWVGRREIRRAPSQRWDRDAAPVRLMPFSIDGKAPTSELYLSPGHAIFIDGMLIPVVNLINGKTIIADAKPDAVTLTYYHIELDTHEAILAEGLLVETFMGANRDAFDNSDEYLRLYGSFGEPLEPFAPIASYNGGRQELASHIRSVFAPLCDFRKPIDKVRDRIAVCAEFARAA